MQQNVGEQVTIGFGFTTYMHEKAAGVLYANVVA